MDATALANEIREQIAMLRMREQELSDVYSDLDDVADPQPADAARMEEIEVEGMGVSARANHLEGILARLESGNAADAAAEYAAEFGDSE